MEYKATVYYAFCPRGNRDPGGYLAYQRELASHILKHGFQECQGIEFHKENIRKGLHGKPYWAGQGEVCFNTTNTDGFVACGVSNCEIGVDAEKKREVRMAAVHRCCSMEEISYIMDGGGQPEWERFTQIWTLKESCLKMTGDGLNAPLKEVSFSFIEGDGEASVQCSQPGFFAQKRIGEYWVSVCTERRAEVSWREVWV